MSTPTTHRVDAGGIELHVEVAGDGPAVVLTHGVLADARMFEHQVTDLARDHRVITFDLRGHGRSDPPRGGYTIRDVAKDFMRVMDALGVRQAILGGHGVGAAAVLHVALTHPERVRAMILMNASADEERSGDALRAKLFGAALRLAGPRPELLRLAAKDLFSHTAHVAHPDIVDAWIERSASIDGASMARALEMLVARPSVDLRLEKVDIRTLCVAGSQDTLTPPERLQQIVDRMPNARMKTIQRAGHLACVEKPYEVTEVLREFARELKEGIRDDRTGRIIRQA